MTEEYMFELSLLENGLDFILKGIGELYELYDEHEYVPFIYHMSISSVDYKYGVIHLFSGFLLLLKERLSLHMKELIFKGKIKEIKKKLQDNKKELPKTINLDEALERLETGPRVIFSESDIKTIRAVQKHRNNFEHYTVSINRFEINKVIIDFIELVDRFLVNELKLDISSSSINASPETRGKIYSIESVYKRMTDKYKHELIEIGEKKRLKFENRRENILEELAHEEYLNKGAIDTMIICPECDEETLIVEGECSGVCSNKECSAYLQLTTCGRCGEIAVGYEWEEIWCENCDNEIASLIDKDD